MVVKIPLLLSFLLLLSACGLPLGERDINRALFKNPAELDAKSKLLKQGMSEKEAFAILNITSDTPNLEALSIETIRSILYGNSEVRGSPQDLEIFKNKLISYKGYRLPFAYLDRSGSLGFFSWTVTNEGFDQRLIMVFENEILARALLQGRQSIHEKDKSYLWEILWDVIKGSAAGAVEISARKAAENAVPLP